MAKILELHPANVRNNIVGCVPPENNLFYSAWYDSSGNNNHGVLNSFDFNTNECWIGSYDFSNYYGLQFGTSNNSSLTVPTLYNTSFPQNEGTIFFDINIKEYTTNQGNILDDVSSTNKIILRVGQTGEEYYLQYGLIGSDGLFKGQITSSTTANRISLNVINKIGISYKTGASGYLALFLNGVKIHQVSVTDATAVPSSQSFIINNLANNHILYHLEMYNTALTDNEIIAIQNTEWRESEYLLPTLNKAYVTNGDSVTWTAASGNNYPELLYGYIKENYGLLRQYNKGIGGQTSTEAVTNLFSNCSFNADIVTIGLGMNDCASGAISPATTKANLKLMIDYYRARNADVEIILCTPNTTTSATRVDYIAATRAAIVELATEESTRICHFEDAWTTEQVDTYTGDGLHPNEAGHLLLLNLLSPIIDEILG